VSVRIAVLDDYQDAAAGYGDWAGLPDASVDFVHEHLTDDDLVARVGACQVLVAMRERTRFPEQLLKRLPSLRLLVTTGMRNAAIDLTAAASAGITVCGTRARGQSTAELTWALIMGLVRPVGRYDADLRAGRWQTGVGGDLAGRTLGLVGLGRQGQAVARVGAAFGMDVLAWSPNLTPERATEGGASYATRDEVFACSDFVSVHLVLSERTRGLVGLPDLRAMRRDAYLVNTARAGLVDSAALRQALTEGWIAGCALDVYDEEPLPADHWLHSAPNTLLSPHMGYVSDAAYRVFYPDAVEDIEAFLTGSPLRVLQ
jgi:phosphoglycerate dehydrogenase-like enzyme